MLPVSNVCEVTSLLGLASLPQHQQYAHDPDLESVELELDRESRSTFCNRGHIKLIVKFFVGYIILAILDKERESLTTMVPVTTTTVLTLSLYFQ